MKYLAYLALIAVPSFAFAQSKHEIPDSVRIYGDGESPNDWRLGKLKDLNGDFSMEVPRSKATWSRRAEEVRRRILVSCGLWPMPARPPVKATIHGRVERDEYTVERVYFESYPGFFVTGSLYRPKAKEGPRPVVLSPHGHFSEGRFHRHSDNEFGKALELGDERLAVGGRYPLQARCVQLARMGCIVFHYDMVGYADSKQISYDLAHRHSEPRPEMEGKDRWGLFTAQAEMRLQSVFGLQTFNSLRAVDFVVGLDDVDASRIAVTGASGGGTQTMMLAALEPRVAVSFPAVMVSTAMQGGCTCENAACLRVGTGNIEFAALVAPRPQGITYANDWTKELLTKGFPTLKKLYAMHGVESLVEADFPRWDGRDLTYFPHNFNNVCRTAMYHWMNEHLQLNYKGDLGDAIIEREFEPLTVEELTVWNDDHPLPPIGDDFETKFLRELSDASNETLKNAANSADKFRKIVRPALKTLLATSYDAVGLVEPDVDREKFEADDYWRFKERIRFTEAGRDYEIPTMMYHPRNWNNEMVIWASGKGKQSVLNDAGELRSEVKLLLDKGFSIIAPDLFQQGEYLAEQLIETRKVENNRDFAGYTFGYNSTLIGHRVHDLLAMLKMIDGDEVHGVQKTHLIGVEGAAPYAVLTAVLAGKHIDKLAIDDGDFRFADLESWRDPDFLPGAIKYGDMPAMIALGRAGEVWVATADGEKAKASMEPYRNLDAKPVFARSDNAVKDAVDWVVR